jgi:transposase
LDAVYDPAVLHGPQSIQQMRQGGRPEGPKRRQPSLVDGAADPSDIQDPRHHVVGGGPQRGQFAQRVIPVQAIPVVDPGRQFRHAGGHRAGKNRLASRQGPFRCRHPARSGGEPRRPHDGCRRPRGREPPAAQSGSGRRSERCEPIGGALGLPAAAPQKLSRRSERLVGAFLDQTHLSHDEIAARRRACRDAGEKGRWNLLRLMTDPAGPRTLPAAAKAAGIAASWARMLLKRWNAEGPDALADRRAGNGHEPLLTPQQSAELAEALRAAPPDGGLWSGPKLAAHVADRYGVKVTPKTGWVWLRRLGFALKVPRPTHPQAADAERKRRWQR